MKITMRNSKEVMRLVKRMVFLVYQACGEASGWGVFQNSRLNGQEPSEDQVWKCAYNSEDYPGLKATPNKVYGDYVFGRMMKWGCRWEDSTITINEKTFRSDYQSFCWKYPNNKSLAEAALESLGLKAVTIQDE